MGAGLQAVPKVGNSFEGATSSLGAIPSLCDPHVPVGRLPPVGRLCVKSQHGPCSSMRRLWNSENRSVCSCFSISASTLSSLEKEVTCMSSGVVVRFTRCGVCCLPAPPQLRLNEPPLPVVRLPLCFALL